MNGRHPKFSKVNREEIAEYKRGISFLLFWSTLPVICSTLSTFLTDLFRALYQQVKQFTRPVNKNFN